MPLKIKKRLNFKEIPKNIQRKYSKSIKPIIADLIVEKIISGSSPVKGQGVYRKYSKSYEKKKNRSRPVDLLDTGRMLNSIRVKLVGSLRRIEISFKSTIAGYHNEGTDKMPKRQMLPTETGETFTNDIIRKMIKILNKTVSKETRR